MSKCRECFGAAAEAAATASGNMKMILGMSTASVNCARMESCGRGEMRMQGLGRILEEIRLDRADINTPPGGDADKIIRMCYKRVEKIISKHMNDGWISVEDRLPEEPLESVIGWDAYRERCCFVQCCNGRFELSSGETVKIVAWQPLPEPYKRDTN